MNYKLKESYEQIKTLRLCVKRLEANVKVMGIYLPLAEGVLTELIEEEVNSAVIEIQYFQRLEKLDYYDKGALYLYQDMFRQLTNKFLNNLTLLNVDNIEDYTNIVTQNPEKVSNKFDTKVICKNTYEYFKENDPDILSELKETYKLYVPSVEYEGLHEEV